MDDKSERAESNEKQPLSETDHQLLNTKVRGCKHNTILTERVRERVRVKQLRAERGKLLLTRRNRATVENRAWLQIFRERERAEHVVPQKVRTTIFNSTQMLMQNHGTCSKHLP